jgi:hypothetical protein
MNIPIQIVDIKQQRELDYERDASGHILVMKPKQSSLRSSLTLLLPGGETLDLPVDNDVAERLLQTCPPS